jgi:FtsH-binding integral membrane protein
MANSFSSPRSQPLVISQSTEAQVYALFALAMLLTLVGTFLGMQYADVFFTTGFIFVLVIAELAIVFTSRLWMDISPLNVLLFGVFPLLSGITVTPFILSVIEQYVNGGSILLNALASTAFMAAAGAVFARTTQWNLAGLWKVLIIGVVGLIVMGLLQIFFPALQTGAMELFISGAGVIIFALFTVYDLQRIQTQSRLGANPFLLALSLYLDIFNLFLYIVRFMLAISGNRRR